MKITEKNLPDTLTPHQDLVREAMEQMAEAYKERCAMPGEHGRYWRFNFALVQAYAKAWAVEEDSGAKTSEILKSLMWALGDVVASAIASSASKRADMDEAERKDFAAQGLAIVLPVLCDRAVDETSNILTEGSEYRAFAYKRGSKHKPGNA